MELVSPTPLFVCASVGSELDVSSATVCAAVVLDVSSAAVCAAVVLDVSSAAVEVTLEGKATLATVGLGDQDLGFC